MALYFIGLVLSSLGTVYKQRNNPDYAALGASGAILAVLFAYIVYYPKQMLYLYFAIPIPGGRSSRSDISRTAGGRPSTSATTSTTMRISTARITGLIFVGLTDFPAWSRALHQVFG